MNTIIHQIRRAADRDRLITFLEEFERDIFKADADIKALINRLQHPTLVQALVTHFGADIENRNIDELFIKSKDLKKEIEQIKEIGIKVSHLPSDEVVLHIIEWMNTTDIPGLIDFRQDPSLVAGAAVETKGFVVEYSFRDYFEKNDTKRKEDHGL